MPYSTRKPSVQLTIDTDFFNKLVSILNFNNATNIDDENFSAVAEKLKNKLLRYSVPRVNDEGKEFVDVRFFPNEAGDMIWQLLAWGNDINIEEDYFSILKQSREDKK